MSRCRRLCRPRASPCTSIRRSSGSWPTLWPIRHRIGWTTATPSAPGSTPNWTPNAPCATTAAGCIATLQLDYAQRYGVASLKIRHHAQLGYVIEAPAAAVEKLRDFPELTLRQGMANGARFTTPELSDLDRRITEAGERAAARERAVFAQLVREALAHADALAACADALAVPRRRAVGGEAGRGRHLVPPAGDRRRRVPGEMPAAIRWWKRRWPATRPSCRTTATCRRSSACCC